MPTPFVNRGHLQKTSQGAGPLTRVKAYRLASSYAFIKSFVVYYPHYDGKLVLACTPTPLGGQ